MKTTKEAGKLLSETIGMAVKRNDEYIAPEHFLLVLSQTELFQEAFQHFGGSVSKLQKDLDNYLQEHILRLESRQPQITEGMKHILSNAHQKMVAGEKKEVDVQHLISCLFELEDSYACYFIEQQGIDLLELFSYICHNEEFKCQDRFSQEEAMPSCVECLNDDVERKNPLIGRHAELERTIQILCRKEKNNPLHIGEAGVGKTAITYGLAGLLNQGTVPEGLKGAKIYAVDIGGMLSGTQYRGEFEKRFRQVMEWMGGQEKAIVYFDEIHNIVGAGAVNGGSLDVSNMLKPYLSDGRIRFIGATTYEEYKRYFSKSKSLIRRFQNVEIKEPDPQEAVEILKGLKKRYEKFHGVKYAAGVLEYAVGQSIKYLNERFLPDKAIDLIDEAGAYRQIHPLNQKTQTVGKALVDEMLSKICNIPKQIVEQDEISRLKALDQRMAEKIFGQHEAIGEVVNAVRFSRAGLLNAGKPMASLLFVGPTGVGKTEVANALANQLNLNLIRFDMSEYAEKHAVAKLIGAPAGYVGYEEGGLLTEAIRKKPHSVLLLDEIEKAHSDIYHVLLQVMDYATLTDNQGRKADFRNVIIIMTSNAGASRIGKGQIGFGKGAADAGVMMEEVKRVFQPEFRNRLTRIVRFSFIDEEMAVQIAEKKLKELATQLAERKVELLYEPEVIHLVKQKGISQEYGAREIDRMISREIKPLLVDQLLFGKLKKGGCCRLRVVDGKIILLE